ncbi:MAG TPA: ABC transporter permease [Casimicrobiaceae bacterium]|nr:ABC transporter permease [Casimicrobiaceae bacterium]
MQALGSGERRAVPVWALDARRARSRDRALFVNFYRRDLTTRYLGSVTGFAWALLSPLAQLAVYHFVFTHVFRTTGFAGQSFLAFVAVALWPWLAAQEALQRGTVSLAGHADLIRKVAFPHQLVVIASVCATFTLQLIGYLAVLGVLRLAGEPIHLRGLVIALPVWLVVLVGVTGVTFALSALQVFVRDVEHVLTPVLMMLMYLTPILYPLSLVPESVRGFVAWNPFVWVVTRLREGLLDGRLALHLSDAVAVAVALLLFVAGRWAFNRLSPHFEDFA